MEVAQGDDNDCSVESRDGGFESRVCLDSVEHLPAHDCFQEQIYLVIRIEGLAEIGNKRVL